MNYASDMEMELALIQGSPKALSTAEEDEASIARTVSVWTEVDAADDETFVVKAAAIYDLATTVLSTGNPKWRETFLREYDDEGIPLPDPETWSAYCAMQLRMSKSAATAYKRVWEVFAVEMGYPPAMLLQAGKSKLAAAVGTVSKMFPARSPELELALFGDPNQCSICRHIILDDPKPHACPGCSTVWTSVKPLSFAKLLALLARLKAQQLLPAETEDGRLEWTYEIEDEGDTVRELRTWVAGDKRYPLPASTIHAGELPDVQLAAYTAYMAKKHKTRA